VTVVPTIIGAHFLPAEVCADIERRCSCQCDSALLVRRIFSNGTLHLSCLCLGCGNKSASLSRALHERFNSYPTLIDDQQEADQLITTLEWVPLHGDGWAAYVGENDLYLAKTFENQWQSRVCLLDMGVRSPVELQTRIGLPVDPDKSFETILDIAGRDLQGVLHHCAFGGLCVDDVLRDLEANASPTVNEARAAGELRVSRQLVAHGTGRQLLHNPPRGVLRDGFIDAAVRWVFLVAPNPDGIGLYGVDTRGWGRDGPNLGLRLVARQATRPAGKIIWSDALTLDAETETCAIYTCALATERRPVTA
jgi:hypothetical protein